MQHGVFSTTISHPFRRRSVSHFYSNLMLLIMTRTIVNENASQSLCHCAPWRRVALRQCYRGCRMAGGRIIIGRFALDGPQQCIGCPRCTTFPNPSQKRSVRLSRSPRRASTTTTHPLASCSVFSLPAFVELHGPQRASSGRADRSSRQRLEARRGVRCRPSCALRSRSSVVYHDTFLGTEPRRTRALKGRRRAPVKRAPHKWSCARPPRSSAAFRSNLPIH